MKLPQTQTSQLIGVAGQFNSIETLRLAVHRSVEQGFTRIEAYTPFFDEALDSALPDKPSRVPVAMLVGGLAGGTSIYLLQYWINVFAYPLNIGGRALHSWPAFIPPTFEVTVLTAATVGLIGMLVACGLPRLHHPMFDIPQFRRASTDQFFLLVEAQDPSFDHILTKQLLKDLQAIEVWDVHL